MRLCNQRYELPHSSEAHYLNLLSPAHGHQRHISLPKVFQNIEKSPLEVINVALSARQPSSESHLLLLLSQVKWAKETSDTSSLLLLKLNLPLLPDATTYYHWIICSYSGQWFADE